MPVGGLRFGEPVPAGGYAWWYLDGISEDGANAITVIAFIGSVFSPYYAWSGRRDPLNHVAVNVALYGRRGRWAMTERGRRAAVQAPDRFTVGRSGLSSDGDRLLIEIDERCAPLPRRVRGRIAVRLPAVGAKAYPIDHGGEHHWCPLAPATPITVTMAQPALSWSGTGYLDMNFGSRALEETFSHWDWMRVDLGNGRSAILYETEELDRKGRQLGLMSEPDGTVGPIDAPQRWPLPGTFWRVRRTGWSEGEAPRVRRTLEDTPFYVRTELSTTVLGDARAAIHESLSLRRFNNPLVKLMLPFRMPRLP